MKSLFVNPPMELRTQKPCQMATDNHRDKPKPPVLPSSSALCFQSEPLVGLILCVRQCSEKFVAHCTKPQTDHDYFFWRGILCCKFYTLRTYGKFQDLTFWYPLLAVCCCLFSNYTVKRLFVNPSTSIFINCCKSLVCKDLCRRGRPRRRKPLCGKDLRRRSEKRGLPCITVSRIPQR